VRRFRWSARSMHGSRKTADLLTTVFTCRASGENQPEPHRCLPERVGKARSPTVQLAHRPSRKYATFKSGSNVASLAAHSLNRWGRRPPKVRFAPKATVSDRAATCRNGPYRTCGVCSTHGKRGGPKGSNVSLESIRITPKLGFQP
jgi:hypothetical protein